MTKQRIVISSLLFIFIVTTCSFGYITFSKLTSETEDIKNIKKIKFYILKKRRRKEVLHEICFLSSSDLDAKEL